MSHHVTNGRIRFPEVSTDLWELQLDGQAHSLTGVSVAALATAFAVDGFKTAIDMGRCSALLAAQETVLLTHLSLRPCGRTDRLALGAHPTTSGPTDPGRGSR